MWSVFFDCKWIQRRVIIWHINILYAFEMQRFFYIRNLTYLQRRVLSGASNSSNLWWIGPWRWYYQSFYAYCLSWLSKCSLKFFVYVKEKLRYYDMYNEHMNTLSLYTNTIVLSRDYNHLISSMIKRKLVLSSLQFWLDKRSVSDTSCSWYWSDNEACQDICVESIFIHLMASRKGLFVSMGAINLVNTCAFDQG